MASVLLAIAPPASGQGRPADPAYGGSFANYEYPQVKPLTVFRSEVNGHDYIAVCNTDDNSVELWDTASPNGMPTFFKRVPVGLRPVSVVHHPTNGSLYTCNALGDSVTKIDFLADAQGAPQPYIDRTVFVGDDPAHIAFSAGIPGVAFVTLQQQSALALVSETTLEPIVDPYPMLVANAGFAYAPKEPRQVIVRNATLNVLASRGTHTDFPSFAVDLFRLDLQTSVPSQLSMIGTRNRSMTMDAAGNLYVVGGEAQNLHAFGEPALRALPTGFVKSLLTRIDLSNGRAVRDLNDATPSAPTRTPVLPQNSLAIPTDIEVYEPSGSAGTFKLFVTAMEAGAVGIIDQTKTTASPPALRPADQWVVRALQFSEPTPGPISGPTGVAVKYANGAVAGDPGDRVYVLRRLDSKLAVIDPQSETLLGTVSLHNDPTPDHIRDGRRFLYSSRLSIRTEGGTQVGGFNSCSSCHDHARLDGQRWDLSITDFADFELFDANDADGVLSTGKLDQLTGAGKFPGEKGFLVTQSLQGLLNHDVAPNAAWYVTNAPYHWRGDRKSFRDFAKAFDGLLGGPDLGRDSPDMVAFEDFINSVLYPPNPEQPRDRKPGPAALEGMQLFHERPILKSPALMMFGGRSCVQCHMLPEGSNNLLTEFVDDVPVANGVVNPGIVAIVETAALRGHQPKEALLMFGRPDLSGTYDDPSIVRTGPFSAVPYVGGFYPPSTGLSHITDVASINGFAGFFAPDFTTVDGANDGLLELRTFLREFDTGTAPGVGRSFTVTSTSTSHDAEIALLEEQVRVANTGLAALEQLVLGSSPPTVVWLGYYYDTSVSPAVYRLLNGSLAKTREQLIQSALDYPENRVVFTATPLGEDRRVGHPNGRAPFPSGSNAPQDVTLESMVPSTAYEAVSGFTMNWEAGDKDNGDFEWLPDNVPTPHSLKRIRIMQKALGFGQPGSEPLVRHAAPLRFRVAGKNIRPGAVLKLGVPDDASPPPYMSNKVPILSKMNVLELPIYPTDKFNANNDRIWETAVEVDPFMTYLLNLGGPMAQGMQAGSAPGLLDPLLTLSEPAPSGHFDRARWNKFWVDVVNEDGTSWAQTGSTAFQPLSIEPPGFHH